MLFLSLVIGKPGRVTHMPVMQELQVFDIELSLNDIGIRWGFARTQAAGRVQAFTIGACWVYLVALVA